MQGLAEHSWGISYFIVHTFIHNSMDCRLAIILSDYWYLQCVLPILSPKDELNYNNKHFSKMI